jgi:hypothetical protein
MSSPEIPSAAAPLSQPTDGIMGLFHTGLIWNGQKHEKFLTLPMRFEQMSGSKGNISIITDVDVRADDAEFWGLVDDLGKTHIELRKKFQNKITEMNSPIGKSDFRTFLKLGEIHKLDALRLIAEKEVMKFFQDRYNPKIGRFVAHKVMGFGPVTLPGVLTYFEDDSPSELLVRHINNLSDELKTQTSLWTAKYVWAALSHLFKLKSWGPIIWLYMNSVSLGFQKEGGQSMMGTQTLIARLLDRINMSPFDFSNVDVAGYLASVMMLHAGYNLSANRITPEDWISNFPLQILHDFSPANATEHYNGQVDLLSKCGWRREGGSLSISSCPFYDSDGPGLPGIYPIKISGTPDRKSTMNIPLHWGGYNMKQDGSALPTITADFDRMFGWFHDPQAEGVTLNVRSILPWMFLAAPPEGKLYSPMEFWNLYFYTVHSTGIKIIDEPFHPMQWFVGFESILPGNGFPISVNGDLDISIVSGRGESKRERLLSWVTDRAFALERQILSGSGE